jgi:hypothetical protein
MKNPAGYTVVGIGAVDRCGALLYAGSHSTVIALGSGQGANETNNMAVGRRRR